MRQLISSITMFKTRQELGNGLKLDENDEETGITKNKRSKKNSVIRINIVRSVHKVKSDERVVVVVGGGGG